MKKERPYWHVILSLLFSILATVGFIIIAYQSIRILMPFVIGWLIALLASPLVNLLERRLKIVRPFASAIIVILVIAVVVVGLYFGITALIAQLSSFLKFAPTMISQAESGFIQLGETYAGFLEMLPEGLRTAFGTVGINIQEGITDFISDLGQPTMVAAGNFAQNIPHILVSIIIALMASYFLIVYREEVTELFKRVAPESVKTRMSLVVANFKKAIGGYFKAQLQIMVVVFVILFIGLLVGQVHYFALFAFLIALLDVLPILGTGTVLIPWSIYQLLMGDIRMAIILIVTYILTQLAHHLLQPKLVSDGMGIHPLFALFLLYIGFYFGNFITMILAVPAGMIALNIYKAGAFDYITNDAKILIDGILSLRGEPNSNFVKSNDKKE